MKSFLEYVAEDVVRKCGTDLSRTAVVFPNKRASLFFNRHLAQSADAPMWSPAYITISDLFRRHSSLQVGDTILLVNELYKCYCAATGSTETLDHFYGWGQMMIADFDDIDKNMADAKKVFANVRDLHEYDDLSYLSPEQVDMLRRFFSNFSVENTSRLKEQFLKLWNRLYDIYSTFNASLRRQGLAYEGSLYRSVVESGDLQFEYDRYIFVGFNLIQKVEQTLFARIKAEGRAMFYWDFDYYYLPQNGIGVSEAGHFINLYKDRFPNELDCRNEDIYGNFSRKKNIQFISATTENIQARYVAQWIKDVGAENPVSTDTAVVMCNENILQTVVHCIPDEVSQLNVTTGYPLHASPYAAELYAAVAKSKTLADYIAKGKKYIEETTSLSPTTQLPSPITQLPSSTTQLPSPTTQLPSPTTHHPSPKDSVLATECLFRLFTILQRLEGLVVEGQLQVSVDTLDRLLRQIVRSTSVPFSGEPAAGLQLMGVLETRNLDFDNILLLSCNEGNMPKGVNDASFIPHNIRKAYGLTTIDHKVAVYAYYFHRLLQRATNVTILYNSSTEDGNRGEMSRFMLQMMVERGLRDIRFGSLRGADGSSHSAIHSALVEKTPAVMDKLLKLYALTPENREGRALLSPSAINKYMRCKMLFYYNYVLGIKEPETDDEAIDARSFGNIFHNASQLLYEESLIRDGMVEAGVIDYLLKHPAKIESAVDRTIARELNVQPPYGGMTLVIRDVIVVYLKRLLEKDRQLAPFRVVGLEIDVKEEIPITHHPSSTTHHLKTSLGGRIDRLDCIGDGRRLRVVDYKTGSRQQKSLPGVAAIFEAENVHNHSDYYLQTFVYGSILSHDNAHNPGGRLAVSPALFYIQHSAAEDYDPTLLFGNERITDLSVHDAEFRGKLQEVITEMFSPDVPFSCTDDKKICENCAYAALCRR